MKPRALVVRSGVIPFSAGREPLAVDIVEKSSHAIEPLLVGEDALDEPAQLAFFTSQIAARRLGEEPALLERFRQALSRGRIGAVGVATAEALRSIGISPDLIASGSTDSILEQIPLRLRGTRVLLPRAEDASTELPDELARRGAKVLPLVLYRKVPRPADLELNRGILRLEFAAFFPTSPSAALWLFNGISPDAMELLRRTPAAVLGRFTQRYLEAHGIQRVEVAREPSFAAAADVLERLAAARPQ